MIVIVKSHLDLLVFPPAEGIFMQHTVGTTVTPVIEIMYITSGAPGLKLINDIYIVNSLHCSVGCEQ